MKILTFAEYVPAYLGSDLRINQISNTLKHNHTLEFVVMEPLRYLSGNGDRGLADYMKNRMSDNSGSNEYLNLPRVFAKAWNCNYVLGYVLSLFWTTLVALFRASRKKPDLVLLAHPSPNCGLVGLFCSKIFRRPVVLDYPDNWTNLIESTLGKEIVGQTELVLLKQIEKLIVKHSDSIIACSRAIAESAVLQGAAASKIHVIPSGIDFDELPLTQDGTNDETSNIVYSGRLEPWSNIETLIWAMKEVVENIQNVKLTIIGDGTSRAKLEDMVDALNLGSFVSFAGTLSRYEALESVACADVVVSIFNKESVSRAALPVKLLEYMALGKPVITTDSETIRLFVRDGKNGLICQPENSRELARGLINLILSPRTRENMGRLAKQTMIEYFDIKKLSTKYEHLLLEFA